jgi:predicted RNase H-like HicB family nuclease
LGSDGLPFDNLFDHVSPSDTPPSHAPIETFLVVAVGGSLWCCIQSVDRVRIETDGVRAVRQVVIDPGEDGYRVAECPSLPGCISQGENKERAIANIKEAIGGYIAAIEADGLPVPDEHFDTLLVAV